MNWIIQYIENIFNLIKIFYSFIAYKTSSNQLFGIATNKQGKAIGVSLIYVNLTLIVTKVITWTTFHKMMPK
jgi:hypothetical protein